MTMVTRHRRRPDERGRYWALCDVRGDQSAEGGLIEQPPGEHFVALHFTFLRRSSRSSSAFTNAGAREQKSCSGKGRIEDPSRNLKQQNPSENRLRVATIRDQLSPSRHLTFGAHRQTAPGGRRCDLLRAGLPAIWFGRRPREYGRANLFLDPQPASARPSNLF